MVMDRRGMLAGAGATALLLGSKEAEAAPRAFPSGFLWGVATAGYAYEGNNVSSDRWLLENVTPTIYSEPQGDSFNGFFLWESDLDLIKSLGLNSYRFSLEWSRIEPEPGRFSIAMLDYYKRIIEGCRARNITSVVNYNHWSAPRWFSARGGWTAKDAPSLFARFCDRATRHLGDLIDYAQTLNEPNAGQLVKDIFADRFDRQGAMLAAAGAACGSDKFVMAVAASSREEYEAMLPILIEGHRAGKAAIRAVRSDLPVGLSLAIFDDQAVGPNSIRDKIRNEYYGACLEAVKGDDYIGVQNYMRARWDDKGKLPPPKDAVFRGDREMYAPSLANACRYAYSQTRLPILVTEHAIAPSLMPEALAELHKAIAEGVPIKSYIQWTLLGKPNSGGLFSVEPGTFRRRPTEMAPVLSKLARDNAV